jgi:hypothetical protein
VHQAPRMAFSHIGLYVVDMTAMVSFSMKRAEWRKRLQQRLGQEGTIEHRALVPDESSAPEVEEPDRPDPSKTPSGDAP